MSLESQDVPEVFTAGPENNFVSLYELLVIRDQGDVLELCLGQNSLQQSLAVEREV